MPMKNTQRFDKLAIRGFRGLSSLDLDDLGTFNLLVGANDVGKTSVLEAIFLLSGFANLRLPGNVSSFRNYLIREFDDFSFFFNELDTTKSIELEGYGCDSKEHLTLKISIGQAEEDIGWGNQQSKIQNDRAAGEKSYSSLITGQRFLHYKAKMQRETQQPVSFDGKIIVRNGEFNAEIKPHSAFNEIIHARFFPAMANYEAEPINDAIIRKKDDALIEYLNIINPHIAKIAVKGNVVYADIGLKKMIPLNMFGSGTIRAATILARCILGSEKILLVDELDKGIHYQAIPSLLEALLQFSHKQGIQIFATTHSLSILKGLNEALSQQDFSEHRLTTNCYALHRDKDGIVRSYRYKYSQFEHCITKGIEIR